MTEDINDLERDIEASRARLDHTIVKLQDRMSVSGIVDDMLGQARGNSRLGGVYDEALAVVRRNPVPVMLIAAGIGLLLARIATGGSDAALMRRRGVTERDHLRRAPLPLVAEEIPVVSTGAARVYDPDLSPRHPTQDSLESRRELSARA